MSKHESTVTLPNDCDVVVARSFDAPRTLVYDAWTKPALVQRWLLGPPGWTMPVCEMDVRPLVTSVLTEKNGATTQSMTIHYASQAVRDAALKTGMTDGMEQSFGKLEGLLVEMAARRGS